MNNLALLGAELCYWWEAVSHAAFDSDNGAADNPAVFRWVVREAGTARLVDIFVGETARLSAPAAACVGSKGTETCCAIHDRLQTCRSQGHTVQQEILRFTYFEVGGQRVTPSSLSDRTVRRLLKHLFTFQYAQEGHDGSLLTV